MGNIRALVTGGAGFIGSAIARRLLERGDQVRVLDSLITNDESGVPEGAEFLRTDLRDRPALDDACAGIDVIFHQAAIRSVPRSVDDPWLAHDCNVNGTLNLLMAAEKAGVGRLIYASSSSAYGDVGDAINVETMAPAPRSPYAVSKLSGEYYCKAWAILGKLPTLSLRYFNVFGPGQRPDSKYSAVFPAFISALLAGEAPEVHGDGLQARDFTYIDDVVNANLAAASADVADGTVMNVAAGRPKTVLDVLDSVSKELGIWKEPNFVPRRAGDIMSSRADIARAREMLSWEPRADWDQAVKATVSALTS